MKKVCFLIGDISFGGGAERITISIANSLVEEKKVSILSISEYNSDDLVYEVNPKVILESIGIRGWSKGGAIRRDYFVIVSSLRKFINENKIDVLISVQATNMLWVVPALLGTKTRSVCWEHINYSSHKSFVHNTCIFLAKVFAKKIVVLTKRDRDLWNTDKAISISNFPAFNMPDVCIEEKQKVFIAVGRFSLQKAFERLLDVWDIVENSGKSEGYYLEIIGEGEQEVLLRNKIVEKGLQRIEIKPFTKQIDLVYRKASAILMTSLFEGYPMVLIEAIQFGVPAIAFDVLTGPAEIILPYETGFLIEDGNIGEFANSIIEMINDEKLLKLMQNNNLEYRKQFDSASIIAKWHVLLESCSS
jgi:glycosyltransferase involved in cell wall biosynthesis